VGADPPRTTDEARQDLSAGLPPDVALLEVIPSRVGKEDCFQLSMFFRNGEPTGSSDPRELRNQRRPDRVLADELDGRISEAAAVSYYRYLRTWSVGKERLTRWLTMLRTEVPAGLRLIIYDLTNFSIPWELFWHDMEEDPQWLGVAVQVIRWTTVRDERLPLQFRTVADEPVGSEILYHEASGDCGKLLACAWTPSSTSSCRSSGHRGLWSSSTCATLPGRSATRHIAMTSTGASWSSSCARGRPPWWR
jgi:hypothetical protein